MQRPFQKFKFKDSKIQWRKLYPTDWKQSTWPFLSTNQKCFESDTKSQTVITLTVLYRLVDQWKIISDFQDQWSLKMLQCSRTVPPTFWTRLCSGTVQFLVFLPFTYAVEVMFWSCLCVCVCVCLFGLLTFEWVDIETSILAWRYILIFHVYSIFTCSYFYPVLQN